MTSFFAALRTFGVDPNDIAEIIVPAFQNNRVRPSHLSKLTDTKLRDYGIVQGGLREDILSVIGNSI